MNPRFFELAKKVSKLSNHPQFKMGAILLKRSKVQSFGINQLKTHPHSPDPFKTIHCEFHAILNSKLDDFSDCEIYIYRETKDKEPANAKPCKHCYLMLKSLGIKKIYYTHQDGYKSET